MKDFSEKKKQVSETNCTKIEQEKILERETNLGNMKKIAYLTIDDSPSKDMKKKVDVLVSKGIPAIWFSVGRFLKKRSKSAIHAINAGHILANHSYTHPRFSFLPLKKCFEEIQKTDKIIDDIYRKAHVERPAKFFRFPHGDKGDFKHYATSESREIEGKIRKEEIQGFLKKIGYMQPNFENITYQYYRKARPSGDVDWNLTYDVMEWTVFTKVHLFGINSLEKVLKRMDEDAPGEGRGLNYADSEEVIVIHDHSQTTHMFEPIMEKLLSKGLIFKLPKLN